jgi:hypothetical protein
MGKLITIVAVVVVAMFLLPAVALAQPEVCWFYGDVVVNGEDAEDGTVVSAWIGGNKTAETTTSGGDYVLAVGKPGETYPGEIVTFQVDGTDAGVTRTWTAGEPFETDLTIGEPVTPWVPGAEIDVVVSWTTGNSTLEGGVLTLYLGAKPADGAKGDTGATGPQGEAGEDAPGGIALPIVALVIAIIAVGVAMMSMRRRV